MRAPLCACAHVAIPQTRLQWLRRQSRNTAKGLTRVTVAVTAGYIGYSQAAAPPNFLASKQGWGLGLLLLAWVGALLIKYAQTQISA